MDLVSRLDGYLNHEIAYNNPIPIIPPPKTIHDKKDTTLLEMAMKALLKQRLYGNLHNFNTDNNQNKNHLRSRSNTVTKKDSSISSVHQTSRKIILNSPKRNENFSVLEPLHTTYNRRRQSFKQKNDKNSDNKQKTGKTVEKKLSQISSSLDFNLKKSQQRKFSLTNQKPQTNSRKDQSKLDSSQEQYNVGTSFISAIQYFERSKTKSKQKSIDQGIKLPQILDKRKTKNLGVQNSKIPKILFQQDQFQLKISDDFWSFISNSNNQRQRRRQAKNLQNSQSISSSIITTLNPSQTNETANVQAKVSLNSNVNQNLILSKERFQNFIGNEKISIPLFISHILTFFELSNKITDKMKKIQFESIIMKLYNHPNRAWSVAIFRFLDVNCNAKIDSSDLFKIYNTVDQIKSKAQTSIIQSMLVKSNQNQENAVYSSKKNSNLKPFKRQKTVTSQNESCVSSNKRKKEKTQSKVENYLKQKTNESEKISDDCFEIEKNLMKHNLGNVQKLQNEIQKLNLKLLSKRQFLTNEKDHINPELYNSTELNSQNNRKSDKIYLEQGLLEKKDLKLSDLSLILEELSSHDINNKKKVIDIDYKKLNIKLSSAYAQTFIATNHNQQTRINRENLQNIKDKIKDKSKESYQPSLPAIKYSLFYEEKLFLPFKNLFFLSFNAIFNQNK